MIRKSFTPAREPHSKRYFCGFCGTHLTYWSEIPEDEADYVNVTVGSLFGDDLRTLGELGLLPDDAEDIGVVEKSEPQATERNENAEVARHDAAVHRTVGQGIEGDMTWMEEMLDGSRLGKTQKTKRGVGRSSDGTTTVEWEITEIFDDGSEPEPGPGRAKRKLGDVVPGGDAHMQV
jgi:hypothetical protein